jgi:hypothetical protein
MGGGLFLKDAAEELNIFGGGIQSRIVSLSMVEILRCGLV